MIGRTIVAVAALFLAATVSATAAPLEAEIRTILREEAVVGAAVVIVDGNGPPLVIHHGQADRTSGRSVGPDTLFRIGSVSKNLTSLMATRLAASGALDLQAPHTLDADPDLLLAALLNLLDNAERHGAQQVRLQTLSPVALLLQDDGPGMPEAQRAQRQAALDQQHDDDLQGLGLVLADRVCRAHGSRLHLLPSSRGLRLWLGLSAQATVPPEA